MRVTHCTGRPGPHGSPRTAGPARTNGWPGRAAARCRFLLLLLVGTVSLFAQKPGAPAKPAPANAPSHFPQRVQVPAGERLNYSITWRLWKAADAHLTLQAAGNDRQVYFDADTTGAVNVLYPIHDRVESDYTPATFCADLGLKQTQEGRRRRKTRIDYQPDQHRIVLDEQNLNANPPQSKHEIKPIPGCVLNLLSALYYIRSLPLQVGEAYNFPVNEGGKTVEVQLTADLKETVVTPAGSFSTIRTEPRVFNGVFQRSGRMWVWFTDDARHLPVMLKSKVIWGTITAVLTKSEQVDRGTTYAH